MKPDQVPIARPRASPAKTALMIARLPGTSSAPPIPWTARETISCSMLRDTPQATDATVNSPTPTA